MSSTNLFFLSFLLSVWHLKYLFFVFTSSSDSHRNSSFPSFMTQMFTSSTCWPSMYLKKKKKKKYLTYCLSYSWSIISKTLNTATYNPEFLASDNHNCGLVHNQVSKDCKGQNHNTLTFLWRESKTLLQDLFWWEHIRFVGNIFEKNLHTSHLSWVWCNMLILSDSSTLLCIFP